MPPCQVARDQDQVKVFKMNLKLLKTEFLYLVFDEKKRGGKPKDIHQPVPTDLQGTDLKNNRVYVWIGHNSNCLKL
jgi:hypothetical protein